MFTFLPALYFLAVRFISAARFLAAESDRPAKYLEGLSDAEAKKRALEILATAKKYKAGKKINIKAVEKSRTKK